MADNSVDELVTPLVESLVKCEIALSQAEAEYQAALQRAGISPDLAAQDIAALENHRIARENFTKVFQHVRACTARLVQECAPQGDAAGPSSCQPALVQQDVADASDEPISDVSGDLLDLDLNKSEKGKELVHNMAAPEEPVEQNAAAPEETVKNTATSEETVERDTASQEEAAENNTIVLEETVKNTATSEDTLERNTAATEETVDHDTASQEEAAENNMIAPEETVEHSRPKKAGLIIPEGVVCYCTLCCLFFETWSRLEQHNISHHRGKKGRRLKCSHCWALFRRGKARQAHVSKGRHCFPYPVRRLLVQSEGQVAREVDVLEIPGFDTALPPIKGLISREEIDM